MYWFLTVLFWNPAIQGFDLADGWAPLPMPSYEVCQRMKTESNMYLPAAVGDVEYLLDCVEARTKGEAAIILINGLNKGDPV